MILDLPETTTSDINKRLVELRAAAGAITLGRVLTLVVVTSGDEAEDAIRTATDAGREHPSRILVVVSGDRDASARLDAQVRLGGDAGAGEVVVLRVAGELAAEGASVVVPLLLPDAPIVAWWPSTCPDVPSQDPIGRMAQRRITDAAAAHDPVDALQQRARTYTAGDTDLAWTRTTRWRALLAAALDLPPGDQVTSAEVRGAADSASSELLAAWLRGALRCPVERRHDGDAGLRSVTLERESGRIQLDRAEGSVAVLSQPDEPDHTLSLPRRTIGECLSEELRRLDPDAVYGEVVTSLGVARSEVASRGFAGADA